MTATASPDQGSRDPERRPAHDVPDRVTTGDGRDPVLVEPAPALPAAHEAMTPPRAAAVAEVLPAPDVDPVGPTAEPRTPDTSAEAAPSAGFAPLVVDLPERPRRQRVVDATLDLAEQAATATLVRERRWSVSTLAWRWLIVPLGAVVTLLRVGGGATATLYAEDGDVFLADALAKGPVEALLTPYNGYLHVVPRLLAEVVALAPVSQAATVAAVLSALVVGGLAALAARVVEATTASRWAAPAVAVLVVGLPLAQEEVLANLANLHWYLLFAAALCLVWVPPTRAWRATGTAVVALAVLSDPLALGLVPLAAVRVLGDRALTAGGWPGWRPAVLRHAVADRAGTLLRRHTAVVALLGGLLVQALAVVALDGESREAGLSPTANPLQLGPWFLVHVVGRLVLGARAVGDGPASLLLSLLALAGLAWVTTAWWRSAPLAGEPGGRLGLDDEVEVTRPRRVDAAPARAGGLPVALAATSVLFFVLVAGVAGTSPPRYAATPALLLGTAVLLALDHVGARRPAVRAALPTVRVALPDPMPTLRVPRLDLAPRGWLRVRLLLVAVAATTVAANLVVPTPRADGPTWAEGLAGAEASCAAGADVATVELPPGPTWTITLDCADL